MKLQTLGWNPYWEAQWSEGSREACVPARVIAQHKKFLRLAGEFGECWGEPAGKMFFDAKESGDLPATGDWVAAAVRPQEERATIHALLPRRTKFSRQAAGKRTGEQIVAANIDTVFIVSSLNHDLNARRLERFLALTRENGCTPVVILSKADLNADAGRAVAEMESTAMGAPVHAISAVSGAGLEALEQYFHEGQTLALLGSSGVGKSTLVNLLLGHAAQTVLEIREGDDRGRHATAARELFLLPGGGLILDTPGMRELQLWEAGDGLRQTFADIRVRAENCRFRDCRHEAEPGCAIRAALENGTLDAGRWESLRKLEREQQFQLRKIDVNARMEDQKRWKQIHKQQREQYKQRRKEGRGK